jgi:hypothetical protein
MKPAPHSEEYLRGHLGTGDWEAWGGSIEGIIQAAARWRQQLEGVNRPWLCWNVSPRWCVLQQRLVRSVGWTPVVGYDPRVGPPPVEVLSWSVLSGFL